jgi:hypothetical protein
VSANSWKVFPNPFKDSLTIQAGDAKLNITKVRLYSSAGQLVLERNWQPELKQLLIHTEDLPSGTYIVAVESSGQWTTQGVVHGR